MTPSIPSLITFQGKLPEPDCYRPDAQRVLAGDPAQKAWNLFTSADRRFNCGIWQAEIGHWRVSFTENEFCQILEGVIIVRGDDGSEHRFAAGDAFVSPAGFTGTWEVVEPARKLYAVYE